jgi:hypothetical protein
MYDTIRRIHLYTGVGLLAYVVMYFVTGYVLIHADFFPATPPVKTTRDAPLAAAPDTSAEEYSDLLRRQFSLAGKRQPPVRTKDGGWKFEYVRPGVTHEAVVPKEGGRVRVTTSEHGARQVLVQFHRLHGYGGGWVYDLWMVLYDLASAAMIVFALSGIYLWYKLTRRRLLGWALLAASFAFTAGTVIYLANSA